MPAPRHAYLAVLTLLAVAPAPARAAQEPTAAKPAAAPAPLQFDFQDADLRLVLSALAEAGHLNLVYSELPQRHVTLRTNQAIPADQILPLLRSLAASNGLKVTEDGAFIRVEDVSGDATARAPARGTTKDTTAGADVRLFVYRLKHARAVRLAATLQSIFGGQGRPADEESTGPPPTLSQELRGDQVGPAQIGGAQQPAVSVQLQPPRAPASLPGRLRGDVQIVPDEATNSLLIRAQSGDWDVLRQSIESLDLRPLQVLIEVLIAEVRNTKDFELGTAGRVGADSGRAGVTGTLSGAAAGDFALRVLRFGHVNVDVALSALSSIGEVHIVSRPVVLAQNNQEARILIGSERPFVQVFRSLPTDAAVRDQVVQYKDVGTQLSLTPTINEDGYVNLQISQQVSNATSEVQFGAPVISTRETSTHLFVRDGQTAVIGGLVDRNQTNTHSGIPILKDLPLLGALFGSTSRTDERSELFVLLTPHIILDDADMDRVREGAERGTPALGKELRAPPVIISPPRDSVP